MTRPAAPVPRRALEIEVAVNGAPVLREVEARMTLADFLRHELGLTGTHVGCEQGVCGACTVLVDGHATRSCILYAVQADGCRVDSVERLADGEGGYSPPPVGGTESRGKDRWQDSEHHDGARDA